MPDETPNPPNPPNPPNQQQEGTESTADATGSDQAAQDQGQDRAGAQGPPEGDDLAAETDVGKLRHEAASRRRALRAVEKERDALLARVDRHDRAEVERLVSPALADASDIWSGAAELDTLRGEDGLIGEAKVGEALAALLDRKPHFAKAGPNLHQGYRPPERQAPSFGQALKGGGR